MAGSAALNYSKDGQVSKLTELFTFPVGVRYVSIVLDGISFFQHADGSGVGIGLHDGTTYARIMSATGGDLGRPGYLLFDNIYGLGVYSISVNFVTQSIGNLKTNVPLKLVIDTSIGRSGGEQSRVIYARLKGYIYYS